MIDSSVVQQLLTRRARPGPLATLTEREHEVLGLVAQGLLNDDVARQLFISERTVEVHIRQVFNKLGSSTSRPATDASSPCWPTSKGDADDERREG